MAQNRVQIEDGWLIQRTLLRTRRIALDAVTAIDGRLVNRVTYDEVFIWATAGDMSLEIGELDAGFAAIANWIDTLPGVESDWRAAIELGDLVPIYRS